MHGPARMTTHAAVENLYAVKTADGSRVLAVEWQQHDVLTCDGEHLELNTDGWLRCPVSGCRWEYDPEFACPRHSAGSS